MKKDTIFQLYEIFKKYPIAVTDSRKIVPNCIFFALKGENFDGNRFAAEAIRLGAACSVVDDKTLLNSATPEIFVVENVLETLQMLALFHRRQFDIPIIAITGSNGKTTTKELINSVLSTHYTTHSTAGNFNNHIGVPLTLLAMPPKTDIAVVEMGANHQKEIEFLCSLAEPTHGIVTNMGKAHLEGFGGEEGVRKGKSELYKYLSENHGIGFINMSEPFLTEYSEFLGRKRLFYTESDNLNIAHIPFEVQKLSETPNLKVQFIDENQALVAAQSHLAGDYNFKNLMTAIVVGKYFKVPAAKIKQGIENYKPNNNRSQWVDYQENKFFMDAYNANPTSMAAAVESFFRTDNSNKFLILGGMKELGEASFAEHQNLLQMVLQRFQKNQIILVGSEFCDIAQIENVTYFDNVNLLKDWFQAAQFKNQTFFLKGSRSIGLEKLLQ